MRFWVIDLLRDQRATGEEDFSVEIFNDTVKGNFRITDRASGCRDVF